MLALSCLLVGALVAPAAGQPAVPEMGRIEAFLLDRMRANEVPGLAYALVFRDRVVRTGAWGEDGWGRPMTPRTPMGFGSVSKPLTATAIMRLVDAGRVRLDEPVLRYLPWFRLADQDHAGKITVRHLLEQTSGISPRDGYARSDRDDNAPDGVRRWVSDLASAQPSGPPGQVHRYSPANAMILAALAEQITGLSFADFLRRELFLPLDMADAIADAHQAERMPPGHEFYFGMVRRAPRTFDTSAVPYGYVAGSTTDLAHLAILHTNAGRYDGTRVLSERTVTHLHRPGPTAPGGHYGPGWRIGTLDSVGARIVWHAGAVTGYHTVVIAAPERGWAVAVQQNAWSFLRDASLNAAAFGALTLALGGVPDPPATSSAALPLLALGAVLLALVVGLVVAVRRLATRHPDERRTWPSVLGAATGLAAGVVCAMGVGWWLPHGFNLDLRHILRFQTDLGHLAVAVIALGLTLSATTAALLVRTLFSRRGLHSGG